MLARPIQSQMIAGMAEARGVDTYSWRHDKEEAQHDRVSQLGPSTTCDSCWPHPSASTAVAVAARAAIAAATATSSKSSSRSSSSESGIYHWSV